MTKGIVLFITLSFITLISFLLLQNLSFQEKALNIQTNTKTLLFKDLILKNILTLIKQNQKKLQEIDKELVIPYKIDNYFITIKVKKLDDFMNINYIFTKKEYFAKYKETFFNYLDDANVLEPQTFVEILFNFFDKKFFFNIQNMDIEFIANKTQFEKILQYYIDETGDLNIKKVPFDEFVFFGPKSYKNGKDLILIEVNYKLGTINSSFSLLYDLKQNKMVGIFE